MGEDQGQWVIALQGGCQIIGVAHGSEGLGTYLEPVYELQAQVSEQPMPDGSKAIRMGLRCNPILMLSSITRLALVGVSIRVDSLSEADQRVVMAAVRGGEQMCEAIRMQQAGIVPAKSMPGGAKAVRR